MAPAYQGILRVLSALDILINARNIASLKNKFFGATLGLFKGGTFVLIAVLILQSMSWVTQNHAWVETTGALRTFQDWSVDIKPVLSKHLLFVELEPGDVVVEFIESEIFISSSCASDPPLYRGSDASEKFKVFLEPG